MGIWDKIFDLLKTALEDTGKLIRLIVLFAAAALLVVVASLLLMRFLPARSQITIPVGKSGNVVFERQSSDYEADYVVVIHPQGWQETGIQVRKGDAVRLSAEGSVAIDLQGLVASVNRRIALEDRARALAQQRHQDLNQLLPERQWTPDQIKSIMPRRAWTGPNGYAYWLYDTTSGARTNNKMMPQARYGALLMAFSPTGQTPTTQQVILVGRGQYDNANPCEKDENGTCVFHADRDGKLWFIVNDVWDSQDSLFPDKFYIDNIGQFYARVSVTEAGHK